MFLLRSGVVYDPIVKGMLPHTAPVTVTSLDPNDMATITGLDLRNGNNVTFTKLKFEFWGTPGYQADVVVNGGDGVRFVDNVFTGQATAYAAIDSFKAQNALSISIPPRLKKLSPIWCQELVNISTSSSPCAFASLRAIASMARRCTSGGRSSPSGA